MAAPAPHLARARSGGGFAVAVCFCVAAVGCGLDAPGPLGAACAVDDNCPEGYACVELLDAQGLPLRSLCAPLGEDVEQAPRLPLVSADVVVTRPNQSASIAVRDRDILELTVKEQPAAGGGSVVLDGGRLTYTAGAAAGTFGFVLEGRGFKGDLVTARFEAVVVDEAAITHTWRGGGGDVFQDSTQWLQGTVPGAADTVFVPAGAPSPRLSADATVGVLLVETGGPAIVTTDAFALRVQSAAHLGAEPAAGATVDVAGLAGAPARVAGRFSRLTVSGEGSAGPVRVSRDVVVDGAGLLDVGSDQTEIDGDLSTRGGGRLRMRAPQGVVVVHGNASFGGGDETAELTAGLLRLDSGFEQRQSAVATTFVGQGTHTTLFEGVAFQGVTFESAGPSRFGAVVVDNGGGIALLSEAVAVGDRLELRGETAVDGAASALSVGRGLLAPAGTALSLLQLSVAGPLDVQGAYDVEVTAFTGNGDAIPAALPYRDVVVVGPTEIDGATAVGGRFTVESELFLDGNTVTVAQELVVQGQGRLVMTNPADLVQVAGDVTFAGRDTDLALRAGRLEVQGALTQSVGAALEEANLVGSGEHTVALTGAGAEQALFFSSSDVVTGAPSRLLDLVIEAGAAAVAQTALRVDRQLQVRGQLRIAEGVTVDAAALSLDGGEVVGAVTCNGVACPQ